MFNNLKYYNKQLIVIKFFIILFLFWLSINTGSKYLDIQFLKKNFSTNKLNFIRALLPYFVLIYLVIYNFLYKKNLLGLDLVFKLFVIYGLLQISGLVYYKQNLYEHYWVICLFSLLFYYHSIVQEKNKNLINSIFYANIFFIIIIFLVFIFITFKENIFSTNLLYHSNSFFLKFQNEDLPRSSGLSRMSLIIFLFLNAFYLSKNFSKKTNFIFIFCNILAISIILLLQSRGAILSFILIFILINILYKFENFIFRLKYISLFLFIPCLIFLIYPNAKNFIIKKFIMEEKFLSLSKKEIKIKKIEIGLRNDLLFNSKEREVIHVPPSQMKYYEVVGKKNLKDKIYDLSTNRFYAWEYLLQIFFKNEINENMKKKIRHKRYDHSKFLKKNKKNFLTGHGPQADRHFLYAKSFADYKPDGTDSRSDKVLGPFGAHASNGYVYSLICAGVLGFLTFFYINIIIFYKILKILIHKRKINFDTEPLLSSSILIIIFLQFRLLIENSFSVYGVDLLILISAYLIVNTKYKEINN